MAIGLFLPIDGHKLISGQAGAVAIMLGVAYGEVKEKASAAWIALNVRL